MRLTIEVLSSIFCPNYDNILVVIIADFFYIVVNLNNISQAIYYSKANLTCGSEEHEIYIDFLPRSSAPARPLLPTPQLQQQHRPNIQVLTQGHMFTLGNKDLIISDTGVVYITISPTEERKIYIHLATLFTTSSFPNTMLLARARGKHFVKKEKEILA